MIPSPTVSKDPGEEIALFPAMAIPVQKKMEHECPQEHEDALRMCIPEVTKLLVIGWRAMEQPFLKLLGGLQQGVPVKIVAGSTRGATEVHERLNGAFVGGHFATYDGGFTQFVISREADSFLSS